MSPIVSLSVVPSKARFLVQTFFCCLVLLFTNCTQPPLTQIIPPRLDEPNKEFVIVRNYETSWNALVRTLEEKTGPKIKRKNKTTGTVVLEPISVEIDRSCDCGKLGSVPLQGPGLRKTVIRVQKRAPQETLLIVSCQYSITYSWKNVHGRTLKKETIPCISNGMYELDLYELIIGYMAP